MLNNSMSDIIPRYTFGNAITIVNLGDIHYGSVACNRDFLQSMVDYIAGDDSILWLSTGDILDINISKSKFHDPSGLEVNHEFNTVTEILQPIATKCLGFVGSNHSERIHKLSGLNFDQILAKVLNIPYLGGTGLINCIVCNDLNPIRYSYYIVMNHGRSNALTLGSKANSMQRLSEVFSNVDLVLEGHTHTFMTSTKEIQIVDKRNNRLRTSTVTMCVCGHCLNWARSYASDNKLSPTPMGFPEFRLNNYSKKIDVGFITPNDFE
jgi:UDP-2,3-diacylglucosamine pyrophosphatase LpxH